MCVSFLVKGRQNKSTAGELPRVLYVDKTNDLYVRTETMHLSRHLMSVDVGVIRSTIENRGIN